MSKSTGPVIAIGAITLGNEILLNNQAFNPKVPIATGIAVGILALLEKVSEPLAVGIAYIGLLTVLLARVNPGIPSPTESLLAWLSPPAKK